MLDAPTPDTSDLRRVCEQPYGFWLDRALADTRLGRSSLFGAEPGLILRSRGPTVELWTRGGTHRFRGSPFETLRALLRERFAAGFTPDASSTSDRRDRAVGTAGSPPRGSTPR